MDSHAIVVADVSGVIQLWSRGAEALFGHAARDAVGKTLDFIVPPEYREAHWNGFRRAMETGAAAGDGQPIEQLPVNCASGVMAFPGTFRLLRDADQTVIGAMLICTAPKAQTAD